jgi:hypothetical protein
MLLGQVALTCRFQAQCCYVDFNTAELKLQVWATCLSSRGVNPTF